VPLHFRRRVRKRTNVNPTKVAIAELNTRKLLQKRQRLTMITVNSATNVQILHIPLEISWLRCFTVQPLLTRALIKVY
jgi:hypothetical protein